MRMGAGHRAGRLGACSGAALLVLLAVLVHVLACAHGPALAGEGRADSIAAASGPSCDRP
ncbi:hypothetical protein G3M55_53100, partial [Streptomyces sp. SID8455]|nr:hypothetical protein [Streptomyces sp. SID8455]